MSLLLWSMRQLRLRKIPLGYRLKAIHMILNNFIYLLHHTITLLHEGDTCNISVSIERLLLAVAWR